MHRKQLHLLGCLILLLVLYLPSAATPRDLTLARPGSGQGDLYTPAEGVVIDGPASLEVGEGGTYTATLPLVFRGWNACHLDGNGFWEVEPNGSFTDANGPLCSGPTYYANADDPNDYFYFHSGPGHCEVRVGNPGGCTMSIRLFGPPPVYRPLGWDNSCLPVLEISSELTETGDYSLRVYAALVLTPPYTVQVTFPQP